MTRAWTRAVDSSARVQPELWVRLARSCFSPADAGVSEACALELFHQAQAARPTTEAARLRGQLQRLAGDAEAPATLAEAGQFEAAGQRLRPVRPPGAPAAR